MKVKSSPGFRLLALNLALILLCTVCLPTMASAASGSYDIYVGNTHFKSTESASGSGWAYDPDYGILVLSGYNGGPIYADGGDLFIASSGNNTVTGNRSQGGGTGNAIEAVTSTSTSDDHTLVQIYVYDGTLTVKGNTNSAGNGANAIRAYGGEDDYSNVIITVVDGDLVADGGDGIMGGTALFAGGTVELYSEPWYAAAPDGSRFYAGREGIGEVRITGGDATSRTNTAGAGIFATGIYLDVNGTITGGYARDSRGVGHAVAYLGRLEIGNGETGPMGSSVYLELNAGDEDTSVPPIDPDPTELGYKPPDPILGEHIQSDKYTGGASTFYSLKLYPEEYTTTFEGNGGDAASGNSPETHTNSYPYFVDFEAHKYERDGYYLYGFQSSVPNRLVMSGDPTVVDHSDGDLFVPYADTTLTAQWAPYDNDTVLFLGNHGAIGGQNYATKSVGQAYTPPTATRSGYTLLGWSSDQTFDWDSETFFLSPDAVWKSPGAQTSDDTQAAYYAQWATGLFIRYNGNGGETANGSNMAVQGVNRGDAATIGGDLGFAREGYQFSGWATSPSGGTSYTEGQEVTPTQNLELYAQWSSNNKTDVSNQISFTAKGAPTYTGDPIALNQLVNEASFNGTPSGTGRITYTLDGKSVTLNDTLTNAGTYTMIATYEDDTQIGTKELEITIQPATIDVAGIQWNYTAAFTYDGNEKTVTLTGLPETVTATYEGNTATDAGTYTASVTLEAKDSNYTVNGSVPDCDWEIQKAPVRMPAAASGLVFNGKEQTGVAVPDNALYTVSGNTATDAGDYEAILSLKDGDNYAWDLPSATSDDQSIPWSIAKAEGKALTGASNIRFNVTDLQSFDLTDYLPDAGEIEITDLNVTGDVIDDYGLDGSDGVFYRLTEGLTEDNAGDTATITATFDSQNYESSTMTWTVTVMDKNDVSDQMTFEDGEADYNGQAQTYEEAFCELDDGEITYTYSAEEVKNAGTYTVTATYEDAENRGTCTAVFTILPVELSIDDATADDKVFDGTTDATVHDVIFDGLVNDETLTADDYTISSASFDTVHQGSDKTVTYTVTLNSTGTAANYILTESAAEVNASITKKPLTVSIAAISDQTFNGYAQTPAVLPEADGVVDGYPLTELVDYTVAYENNFNAGEAQVVLSATEGSDYAFEAAATTFQILKAAAPTVQNLPISIKYDTVGSQTVRMTGLPSNCGTAAYTLGTVEDPNGILSALPVIAEDGTITYTLTGQETFAEGLTATIPVTVVMQNYEDVTVNVVITLTEKDVPVLTVQDIEKDYDGQILTGDDIRGTAEFDGASISGTWTWVTDPSTMINANVGGYSATVQFTPDNADAYASAYANLSVIIHKAVPTGSPEYTAIRESGKTLADANLTAGDILPAGGTISWDLPETTEVTSNTSYAWTYRPADTTNYEDLTGTITLWRRSSGGGSSGGSASYRITVEEAEHGSITVDSTTASQGDQITITVAPDDGYTLDTLTATARNGSSPELTKQSANQYTFTMPASSVTVKATFTQGDAPEIPFKDVAENAWYYEAVKYAYDNELMNGVKDDTFAPNSNLNRAMIAQVLYNLEGEPGVQGDAFSDVAEDAWYFDAVNWAAENKIVEGYGDGNFGPTRAVTREQLAAILFRYAQYKGMDSATLEENLTGFTDGDQVSSWAVSAMNWAVGQGIMNGKGNSTLDPQGTATRAEVAKMLLNFNQLFAEQQ